MIQILAFIKANWKPIAIALVVLTLIGLGIFFGAKLWRGEMQRMENNYLAALQELRKENSDNMRVLDLKIGEVKAQYPEIQAQLKAMDIKLKNVETIQNVNTVTNTTVNTVLRDSTIRDSVKVKVAVYNDKWTDFKLFVIDDSVHSNIVTKDSLFIVLNKTQRTFRQWITFKPKVVRSTVKNYNPNSVVTYNRLIRIDK
jgi:hypothetical protein